MTDTSTPVPGTQIKASFLTHSSASSEPQLSNSVAVTSTNGISEPKHGVVFLIKASKGTSRLLVVSDAEKITKQAAVRGINEKIRRQS